MPIKKPKPKRQPLAKKIILQRVAQATQAERDRCAKLIPTSWLDPLLSGKDAPKLPLGAREVEALLRGIQDRIRTAPI